jgi:superfamily II DNA or RNA helicase
VAIELYEDQKEALDAVLTVYKEQPQGGRAQVVAPTGWGKTIFFSFLAKALKHLNILIIAHRDELLDQAREKIQWVDPTTIVGKVGGGAHEYGAPVTVAGIDTISGERHLKNLHKFNYGLVIWDENHHCQADNYVKTRLALKQAFHVGVTATPDRLDGKSLEPLFGKPVFSMDIKQAVTLHRLCDIRCIAVQTETSLDDLKTTRNVDGEIDFNERQLASAIDNPARNALIAQKYLELAEGRRAICFGVSVLHCQHMTEAFIQAGIPAAYVTGSTTKTERKQIYQQLASGEIKILSSVQVLTEGFDLPQISCVIAGRPTESRALYTQMVGRGLRLAPGKKDCLILDITDNCFRLRLTPQNFRHVVGKIKEDETLLQSMEREEDERADKEAAEKRAIIRKLNERRQEDKQVDLFGLPEWQERPGGLFVMEVGAMKHRIALVPCASSGWAQLYDVQARLAPTFQGQKWLSAQPLDYAMQVAEKKARMLVESIKNTVLVDRNAAWRSKPVDPSSGQAGMLKMYRIPFGPGTDIETKGQASDAIDERKRQIEERNRKKAERAAARAARNEVSA